MDSERIVQGRLIGPKELESIRLLLSENPHWSRWRLSRALCELWDWRAPNGQMKVSVRGTGSSRMAGRSVTVVG